MKKKEKQEAERIEKLFSEESMLRHWWYVNALVYGKIKYNDTKKYKQERFERFKRRKKEKGVNPYNLMYN